MAIRYDKKAARYRDDHGRFINSTAIRRQLETTIEIVGKDFRGIGQAFNEKKITADEFEKEMKERIKSLHTLSAAVGRGGRKQMTASDWGKVGARIKKE